MGTLFCDGVAVAVVAFTTSSFVVNAQQKRRYVNLIALLAMG